MKKPSLKMLIPVGALLAAAIPESHAGVEPSNTLTSGTISSITEIRHGSSDTNERLDIVSGSATLRIDNKSASQVAARILATCYKNAQFVAANGGSLSIATKNLDNNSSAGITGKLVSGTYTITFTENYPVSGEQRLFMCGAKSPTP